MCRSCVYHAAQVPDVDELKAKNAFETSRQLGQAIITTALKEHAGVQTPIT